MKKLLKIVVGLLVVVVLVVGVALYFGERIAKTAVERGASSALAVPTTLQSVKLALMKGQCGLTGLNVSNPEGFQTAHFLNLGQGEVQVNLGSLLGEKVVVPRLALSGIDVNLEKRAGKANYMVIIDNLKQRDRGDAPAQQPREGKKFVVEEVVIEDVTVRMTMPLVGSAAPMVPLHIQEIRLRNVGSESDRGLLLAELSSRLTKAILAAIAQQGGNLIPADIANELSKGVAGLAGVSELGIQIMGQAGQVLQSIGGQATQDLGKAAEDVSKDVGDKAKGVFDGLDGLLKPKKEDDSKQDTSRD